MKSGGLFTAVGILIVLGGLVWWSNKHPSDAKKDTTVKILALDSTAIDQIRINHAGAPSVLLKKVDGEWKILEPRPMAADPDVVNPLSGAIAAVNAERIIDEHPGDLEPFGLKNPSEEIDATTKDGKVYKLLVGSDTPNGNFTYVMREGDPKLYTVSSVTKTDLNKGLNDCRDKRLMTFDSEKLKSLTLTAKAGTFEFGRDRDNIWQIVKPKVMRADAVQFDDLTRRLKDARMDIPADYNAKTTDEMFEAGTKVATANAVDDTVNQTLEVRKGNDGNYYAKTSFDPDAYKIANDTAEGLDKKVEEFRAKRVFNFAFNEVRQLTINGVTYVKSGAANDEKWNANGVQFDAVSVEDVIDKMRDLTALDLSDKMGGTPVLTIADNYGDKGSSEKVTISKDGSVWRAVRSDDPGTSYTLIAANVDELQKTIAAIKQYQPPKKK